MVCSYTAGYSSRHFLRASVAHQGQMRLQLMPSGPTRWRPHGHAPDALLSCGVGGLAGLAEQARAGGKLTTEPFVSFR